MNTVSNHGPLRSLGIPSIAHRLRAREDGVGNDGGSPMWRIAIIAGCLTLVAAQASAQDKATIVRLNDAWAAAFNRGDASAVAAMYTADAFALPPGAEMVKGHAAIEAFWRQAAQQMGDAKFTTIDVLALGPGGPAKSAPSASSQRARPRRKSSPNTPSSGARRAGSGS